MKFPVALFIMGRPGSGKDTQADLLSKNFDLVRISTSGLIKQRLYDSKKQNDEMIKREKDIFESGMLNTPSWVVSVVKEHLLQFKKDNFNGKNGVVFSGSPRTPYESENLMPFLENVFSKQNMLAVYLDLSEQDGLKRIRKRNKLTPRELDEGEKKLAIRTDEFNNRTLSAINYLEDGGYLVKVDGSKSVEEIERKIKVLVSSKLS